MKPIVDLTTWLLEKDIRAKNALSVLLALVTVAIVYFASQGALWTADLDKRGPLALPIAFLVVFVAAFLSSWLIGTVWGQLAAKRNARRKQEATSEQRERDLV